MQLTLQCRNRVVDELGDVEVGSGLLVKGDFVYARVRVFACVLRILECEIVITTAMASQARKLQIKQTSLVVDLSAALSALSAASFSSLTILSM